MANLTIYLIREGLEPDRIIDGLDGRPSEDITVENQLYRFYSKRRNDHPPSWVSFFEGHLPEGLYWRSSQPGVVVLTTLQGRTYALTFGQGRHILRSDCYEDQFGLKVVLNTVESVRALEKTIIAKNAGHSITQASQAANVAEFGFDIEQDLLRSVAGVLEVESPQGYAMSGVDALSVGVEAKLTDLPTLLPQYLHQSTLNIYRERGFGFVDHMRFESSTETIAELNEILCLQLNERREQLANNIAGNSDFELSIPDIVDFGAIAGFKYNKMRRALPPFRDLSLNDYLSLKDAEVWEASAEGLRSDSVTAISADGNRTTKWPLIKCIVGEVDHNTHRYVISDGRWYRVDRDFVADLDAFIRNIPPYDLPLPDYAGGDEDAYNLFVANSHNDVHLFDRDLVHPVYRGPIEFCDLYTERFGHRDLIHVKRGSSSRVLSHLFAQGTVAAELYRGHPRFKDDVDARVERKIAEAGVMRNGVPAPESLRTVFAVIRKNAGELPFFSKVNLRRACKYFIDRNLPHALAEIVYDPNFLVRRH